MDISNLSIGSVINNAGKIGVIIDIFKNEKGDAWIEFASAETIVRNPMGDKTSEFIPFIPHAATTADKNDLIKDVESKIESTGTNLPKRIAAGIKTFSTIIGDVTFVTDGMDAYLLDFADNKQCLIETILGEKRLAYHPKLFKSISREDAVKMATERYDRVVDEVVEKLEKFASEHRPLL